MPDQKQSRIGALTKEPRTQAYAFTIFDPHAVSDGPRNGASQTLPGALAGSGIAPAAGDARFLRPGVGAWGGGHGGWRCKGSGCIVHLSIATCIWWRPFILLEKAMGQMGNMYLVRSPAMLANFFGPVRWKLPVGTNKTPKGL